MSAGHTPGPWIVLPEEDGKGYLRIRGTRLGGRYKVANIQKLRYEGMSGALQEREDAESYANARLIAAAPELLQRLQFAAKLLRPIAGHTFQFEQIEAAIAKATGEAP